MIGWYRSHNVNTILYCDWLVQVTCCEYPLTSLCGRSWFYEVCPGVANRPAGKPVPCREHWGVVSAYTDFVLRPTQGSRPTGCSHGPFTQSHFTHTRYLYDSLRSCPCRRCTKSLLLRQAATTNFTDGRVSNSGFNHCLCQLWYPAISGAIGSLEI